MKVGLYILEDKFPNLAAMKVSTYHRQAGDEVLQYMPIYHRAYDKVYAFSVFSWTSKQHVLSDMVVGGTGFSVSSKLPAEIESATPDYSIYPDFENALGFLTRGCCNNCPWCVVPEKEGAISPYRTIDQVLGARKSAMLMDNNVLAIPFGIMQIKRAADLGVKIDFNQGLDARLVDQGIASLLASCNWIRYIRFALDSQSQKEAVQSAVARIRRSSMHRKQFMSYVLIRNDVEEALDRIEFLRALDVDPFVQPYRDPNNPLQKIPRLHRELARWANMKAAFKRYSFSEWLTYRNYHD